MQRTANRNLPRWRWALLPLDVVPGARRCPSRWQNCGELLPSSLLHGTADARTPRTPASPEHPSRPGHPPQMGRQHPWGPTEVRREPAGVRAGPIPARRRPDLGSGLCCFSGRPAPLEGSFTRLRGRGSRSRSQATSPTCSPTAGRPPGPGAGLAVWAHRGLPLPLHLPEPGPQKPRCPKLLPKRLLITLLTEQWRTGGPGWAPRAPPQEARPYASPSRWGWAGGPHSAARGAPRRTWVCLSADEEELQDTGG